MQERTFKVSPEKNVIMTDETLGWVGGGVFGENRKQKCIFFRL